jgi:phenylacetate-CoA ligase
MNNYISKYLIFYPTYYLLYGTLKKKIEYYEWVTRLSEDEKISIKLKKFTELLAYAYNNIEFYKNKYQGNYFHPDDIKSLDDISKIPIIEKSELIGYNKKKDISKYKGLKFYRTTSGSTGIPFVFYKDYLAMETMDAIQYRNYGWFGIDIGERQARFWGHPIQGVSVIKTVLSDFMKNRIRLSPFNLDNKVFEKYLKQIESFKAQYIYGYSQSIFQFAHYFHRVGRKLSHLDLKAIILTGEMVFQEQIDLIREVFCCPVTEEYGCTEVGVIGFKCRNQVMHIMDNLIVESLDQDYPDGKRGLIIVTELEGRLFPFIRYQVGDRGICKKEECSCGNGMEIIVSLSGRKDEFIKCPNGKLVDPYYFEYLNKTIPKSLGNISQFRIIQTAIDRIIITVLATGEINRIEKYILEKSEKIFSDDVEVSVEFVDSIDKDPSGKQRCFISRIT